MSLWGFYWMFFRYGCICVGGGYVLIPMLIADLVDTLQFMTPEEFSRLMAIAQVTPGPVGINAATYAGFRRFGIAGGLAGTAGLLSPALFLVTAAVYCFRKYENTRWMKGIFAGLRPASCGLVMAAVWVFLRIAVQGVRSPAGGMQILPVLLAAAVFCVRLKTRIHFFWLIMFCGIFGAFFCR